MTTPVSPYVDAAGCHTFDQAACKAWLTGQFQLAVGNDAYLGADTQDGQIINRVSEAMGDFNAAFASAYKARSPATAVGVGLSKIVKINGLIRRVSTYSTCPVLVVGVEKTDIGGALVGDAFGNIWALPDVVEIPFVGQIEVLATCTAIGAIAAPAGTLNRIVTSVSGFQSVVNLADASLGAAVETDAQLRVRQSQSTVLGSRNVLETLFGNIEALSGVDTVTIAENDASGYDANGVPGHCISVIVSGGDPIAIANAIAAKKPPGVNTYGDIVETITDPISGTLSQVAFFRPKTVPVAVYVGLKPLVGYTQAIQSKVVASITAYINALGDGVDVRNKRTAIAAGLNNGPGSDSFEIETFAMSRDGEDADTLDIPIAFNERAHADSTTVVIVLLK